MQSISSPENISALADENWDTEKIAMIAQLSASMTMEMAVVTSTRIPVAAAVSQFAPLSVISRPTQLLLSRKSPIKAQATNAQL